MLFQTSRATVAIDFRRPPNDMKKAIKNLFYCEYWKDHNHLRQLRNSLQPYETICRINYFSSFWRHNIPDIESSTTRRVSEEHSTKKYNTTAQFTNQELLFAVFRCFNVNIMGRKYSETPLCGRFFFGKILPLSVSIFYWPCNIKYTLAISTNEALQLSYKCMAKSVLKLQVRYN